MLKKTVTYTDYEGNSQTEDFYFNLTKAELIELQFGKEEGYDKAVQRIVDAQNAKEIISTFKEIILKAYGEKSPDGKRFVKDQRKAEIFVQSEAYSEMFMELFTDSEKASKFILGLLPQDMNPPQEVSS